MTTPIPPSLKSADISRLALRSAQLTKADPIIAYWCDYEIINRILSKGLHNADDDAKSYALALMDKLEAVRTTFATNDAIHDDMAAQAYVEQFANKVFSRADNQMRSGKSTAQTADTLQAAAVFLELLGVWQKPTINAEVGQKIKYAKVHAIRIAKALKSGEDPNLTNPVDEPAETAPDDAVPALDPRDPEVQRIEGINMQPTVEDDHSMQGISPPTQTSGNDHLSSARPDDGRPDVSPLDPPPSNVEYFPQMPPTFTASMQPTIPVIDDPPMPSSASHLPPLPPSAPVTGLPPNDPAQFYQTQPSPIVPPPVQPTPPVPRAPSHPQMPSQPSMPQQPYQPQAPFSPPIAPAPPQQPQFYAPQPQAPQINGGELRRDDESMAKAAKHAKWAISALNFEDVETAVKELRNALATLGAR